MTTQLSKLLRTVADDIDSGRYVPKNELFDWQAVGINNARAAGQIQSKPTVPNLELNIYFHKTVGKAPNYRTLNHWLNKVNKDWQLGNLRTPIGYQALEEVAKDCNIDMLDMCYKIMEHPRFSKIAIGDAAQEYIALLNQQN